MSSVLTLARLIFLCLLSIPATWATDAPLQKVSLQLQWKHQFEFVGFYAAKEKGFYKDAGLDVEFIEYENQPDLTNEVLEGRATFGTQDAEVIGHRLAGRPVVLLSNYFKRLPLAIVASPEIRTPADLKGKRFMVSNKDIGSVQFTGMFKQFGVSLKDMTVIPHNFRISDFVEGKVDAMSVFLTVEPFRLQQLRIPYNIIDPGNFGAEFYGVNLFTSETYAHKNPETVSAFKTASDRGWIYALDHPDEMVDLILKKYNTQQKSRDALLFEATETIKIMLPKVYPVGSINPDKLRHMAEIFVQEGKAKSIERLKGFIFDAADGQRIALTREETAYVNTHPTLNILVHDRPPFSRMENGQATGFSIEYLNLLLRKIGFAPGSYTLVPIAEGFERLQEGRADIMTDVVRTPEREQFIDFTDPYRDNPKVIVARTGSKFPDIAALADKRVAVEKQNVAEKILREQNSSAVIVACANLTACIYMVSNHQVDAFIETAATADFLIANEGLVNLSVVGVVDNFKTRSSFALRKGQTVLRDLLNKAIASTTTDDRMQLAEKWMPKSASSMLFAAEKQGAVLPPEQRAYLTQKGEIRMCTAPEAPPLAQITGNGKHQGIAADVMTLLTETVGMKVTLVRAQKWHEMIGLAKTRQCDMISYAAPTPELRKFMDFTRPYLTFPMVIVTQNSQPFISDIKPFLNQRFGGAKGSSYVDAFKRRYPSADIEEFDTDLEGLRMVQEGRIFGYVDSLPLAGYQIQQYGLFDLKVAGQLENKLEMTIATRNDEPLLGQIFQTAIDVVPQDRFQEIANHWLSIHVEQGINYTLMWKIIGGVIAVGGVILWIILVWNRKLAKLNRELGAMNKELDLVHAQIAEQNAELEQRVAERTHELSVAKEAAEQAVATLKHTQAELLQAEKLAALGSMVAGVSHELNTPLGNAMLAVSSLREQFDELKTALTEGRIKKSRLESYLAATGPGLDLVARSIERAGSLVRSFKQTAIDQTSEQRRHFDLSTVVEDTVASLRPRYKHDPWQIVVEIDAGIMLDSFPGPLEQIVLNLVMNSIIHGFDGRNHGRVMVRGSLETAQKGEPQHAVLAVIDDGRGIAPEHISRIFDPFFTTKFGQGGSGIGLNIVHRIATTVLGGNIAVNSTPGAGTTFTLHVPLQAPDNI